MIKLAIDEARALTVAALRGIGYDEDEASITADHLVDAGLRGLTFGSLARVLAISERLDTTSTARQPLRVIHETPVSALIDGGDHVGYYVAHAATEKAIEKARAIGMAIVGANNTWYTGLFAYYMEMITRAGFIGMAIGNGPAEVAPAESVEARLGTNPIAWGFPCEPDPVIWDIGTCAIMHGELLLHKRTGEPLPEGVAFDSEGQPTIDPMAALAGAIRPWGGHKGGGLSIVVQTLGALCGGPVISPGMRDMAYLVLAIDPRIMMPDGSYPERVAELGQAIRSAQPIDPGSPVRMPYDRSADGRRRRIAEGTIDVPEPVHAGLLSLAERRNRAP
jgi:LDH2 family malate/lactate/ureidoglycolate dehydrogenase